jgi:protein-S-isoprenylcysteine O-methyltransferase Ste14
MESGCPNTTIHRVFHKLLFVFGIILIPAFIILFNHGQNVVLKILGIILLVFSVFLMLVPIYVFRKRGGVAEGREFTSTTKLVDTGIYAIVRHPQYLGGILLGVSLMMITQHWLLVALGIPFAAIFYLAGWDEDRYCLKKFGHEYGDYAKKVPRFNLILGIIKNYLK